MSPQHTMEVVWIAAKFIIKTRRVRFLTDCSSPLASSISHDKKSICSDGSKIVLDVEGNRALLTGLSG